MHLVSRVNRMQVSPAEMPWKLYGWYAWRKSDIGNKKTGNAPVTWVEQSTGVTNGNTMWLAGRKHDHMHCVRGMLEGEHVHVQCMGGRLGRCGHRSLHRHPKYYITRKISTWIAERKEKLYTEDPYCHPICVWLGCLWLSLTQHSHPNILGHKRKRKEADYIFIH